MSEVQVTARTQASSSLTSLPLLARMLRHLSPDLTHPSELSEASYTHFILNPSGSPGPNTAPDSSFTPVHLHIADVRSHMCQGGVVPNDATRASSYPGRGLSAGDSTPDFYGSPPLRRAG